MAKSEWQFEICVMKNSNGNGGREEGRGRVAESCGTPRGTPRVTLNFEYFVWSGRVWFLSGAHHRPKRGNQSRHLSSIKL